MSKHTSIFIAVMVACIGVCSCSSTGLSKFAPTQMIYFKEMVIKDNVQYDTKQPFLEVIRGDGGELCFEDTIHPKYGEAITVRAIDLQKALDYFYGSRATWNITRVQRQGENVIRTVANSEMQIKYEVAYCMTKEINFWRDDESLLASFRLIKP